MNLSQYVNSLKDKSVTVVGMGVSNAPLIDLLLTHRISVTVRDKTPRADLPGARALEERGAALVLGPDYLADIREDVIFRTPGLHPDQPGIRSAVERGAVLTSEMEVFFRVCPCKIFAITGSDGKTTTTSLIAALLRGAGRAVHLGGNIGTPLLCGADEMHPEDLVVLELSSFQLLTMGESPQIAVITNVSPNHLDVHKDLAEYMDAKKNIFCHGGPGLRLILNYDNDITRSFAPEAPGPVSFFSRQTAVEDGVYLRDGVIFTADAGTVTPVLRADEIRMPGAHNVENVMAAFAAVRGLVPPETMAHVAKTFPGVSHRIEPVRELGGVRFYNDSIASSPSRTIAGLQSFDRKVILIAGGKDKGISYDPLAPALVAHVKTLVLTGATAGVIKAALLAHPAYTGSPDILEEADFAEAVRAAYRVAQPGDIVLLSPASTSFDRFKNFEERGNTFKKIVNELE